MEPYTEYLVLLLQLQEFMYDKSFILDSMGWTDHQPTHMAAPPAPHDHHAAAAAQAGAPASSAVC